MNMRSETRKGQLSIFLILSVVVLFGAMVFFSVNSDNSNKDTTVLSSLDAGSTEQVKSFVDSCVKSSTEDAISLIGVQGGYYTPPITALVVGIDTEQIGIPVYLKDNAINSPHDRNSAGINFRCC